MREHPEVVHLIREEGKTMALMVLRDYAHFCEVEHQIHQTVGKHDFDGDCEHGPFIHFPLRSSTFMNYFEYEAPLRVHYGLPSLNSLDYEGRINSVWVDGPEPVKLGEREARVLHMLVEHSENTDSAIAEELGLHRTTVTRHRDKLERQGVVHTRNIPDLGKVGLGSLVITRGVTTPGASVKQRKNLLKNVWMRLPHVFTVTREKMSLGIFAYPNMDSTKRLDNLFRKFSVDSSVVEGHPDRIVFDTRSLEHVKYHDYAPITRKIFGLERG